MSRGFEAGANQEVKADKARSQDSAKKVIKGDDLRSNGTKK